MKNFRLLFLLIAMTLFAEQAAFASRARLKQMLGRPHEHSINGNSHSEHTGIDKVVLDAKTSDLFLRAATSGKISTTSQRAELKFTLSRDNGVSLLQKAFDLFRSLGFVVKNRDFVPAGKQNVTATLYTQELQLTLPEGNFNGVIRVRKYGTAPIAETRINKDEMVIADKFQEISSLEFKIQDPAQESQGLALTDSNSGLNLELKSVLKPIIRLPDAIIEKLLKDNITPEMINEAKQHGYVLNERNQTETVDTMIDAIVHMRTKPDPIKFELQFESAYARDAQKIDFDYFDEQSNSWLRLNIQITMDTRVNTEFLGHGKASETYNDQKPVVVVEVKVPHVFVPILNGKKAPQSKAQEELVIRLKELFKHLEQNHIDSFGLGTGKKGNTKADLN